MMARNIPPGWNRAFAFMGWPAFRPTQWHHLRSEAEKFMVTDPLPPVFAIDEASTAYDGLAALVDSHPDLKQIQVLEKDFFDLIPKDLSTEPGLIVIDPPYGKRMGTRRESRTLIQDVMRKLKADYRGWKFAMMVPDRSDIRSVSPQWRFHAMYHGGLKLEVLIGRLG